MVELSHDGAFMPLLHKGKGTSPAKIGFRSRHACWNVARDRIKIRIKIRIRIKIATGVRSIKRQMIRQRETTGLPLRNGTKVAPGKATVFEAFRSREVRVSISHLPGPAICRGSLSIHEIDLWRRNIRKIQAQTQSQFRVRERLLGW